MAVQTFVRQATWLKYEENFRYARDVAVIAPNQVLKSGQVVGRVTANGQWAAFVTGAVDGSQNAAGIMLWSITTGAASAESVVVTRECTYLETEIIWPVAITAPQRATAVGLLKAQGMIARPEA